MSRILPGHLDRQIEWFPCARCGRLIRKRALLVDRIVVVTREGVQYTYVDDTGSQKCNESTTHHPSASPVVGDAAGVVSDGS